MKVLMVLPAIFPGDRGSPARVFEMIKTLSINDIEVAVACYKHNNRNGMPPNVNIHTIPTLNLYKKGIGPSYSRIILDIFLTIKIFVYCIKEKPDILHCHLHEGALIGLFSSKFLKIKMIFDIHSLLKNELIEQKFIKKRGIINKITDFLDKKLPYWVDYNITVGQNLIDFYKRINDSLKIEKVPNITDTSYFKPGESQLRKELDLKDVHVIGYQGNMSHLQNLVLLIEVAEMLIKEITNIKFLVGYTSDPEYIKKIILEKKIDQNFIFIPSPFEKASDVINCCDIMVIPRQDSFGVPMKLLNFLACGKPVVMSKNVAQDFVIEGIDVNLHLFVDNIDLYDTLLRLIYNEKLRTKAVDSTLNFIKNEFSQEALFNKLFNIYSKLLNEEK